MNSQDSPDNQKSPCTLSVGNILKILLYFFLFFLGLGSNFLASLIMWPSIFSFIPEWLVGCLGILGLWLWIPLSFLFTIVVFISFKFPSWSKFFNEKRFYLLAYYVGYTILPLCTIVYISLTTPRRDICKQNEMDSGRKSDIGQMGVASEAYYTRNGVYPTKLEDLLVEDDLKVLPKDPKDGSAYSMVGGGTTEIAIYDQLYCGSYWVYKSYCGRAYEFKSLEEATDLTDCSPE